MTELGRELVIPGPVLVEVDQLLRARVGAGPARLFLDAIAAGEHPVAFLSAGLMRRAIEIDPRFADLDLGLVDGCVWRSSGSSPALCGSRAASVPCASRGSDLAEVGWGVNIVLVRLRGEWRIVELGFVYP